MPKYRVLAKFGNSKRRELYDTVTAKTAKEAIEKSKKYDKELHAKARKSGLRGKYALPKSSDWVAVKN